MNNQGFVSAVSHIRSFVPAIYDCTLTVHNNQPTPTLLRMFSGQSSEVTKRFKYVCFFFSQRSLCLLYQNLFVSSFLKVNLQLRRHKMSELPDTDDGIAQWCQDLFITKVHQQYFTHQTFIFTLKFMCT